MTPNPGGGEPCAAVVVAIDAAETASSLSLSSSGSGAMTEETNKWDGGGRGEKRRRHYDKDDKIRLKESGGKICNSEQKTGGFVGLRRVHRRATRQSRRRWPGVVVDNEIDGLLAGREWGDETPSSLLAVVHVTPIHSRAGGRRCPSAGFRRMQRCGCARAGGPAGPGTSAARQGGRRRGLPPNDTAAAAAGTGVVRPIHNNKKWEEIPPKIKLILPTTYGGDLEGRPPSPDHEMMTLAAMAAAPPSALSYPLAPSSILAPPLRTTTTTTKRCDGPCGLTKDESGYSITMWSRGADRRWTCLVCSRLPTPPLVAPPFVVFRWGGEEGSDDVLATAAAAATR